MAVHPSSGLFHRDILEGDPRRRFIPEGASIPRKPVASQSVIGSNAVTSVRDSIPERSHSSLRLRGFERLLLDGTDDEDRSTSWRPSGLPALVESDIQHAQGEVTHPGGQTDALLPQPPNGAVQHGSAASRYNWLPYSLKWPYLLALVLTSFALSATVSVLTWYSIVNRGLGSDTTSTVLLFGWRFSPTLVAVLYVLLETMLLTDVRRTEVFAKLARQKASSASSTILHPGSSWWDDPRDALRKEGNSHRRSWALFWASLANIIGMLVISPLSAGLLSTEDIQIAQTATFNKIAAFHKSPLVATADDATYVQSIAGSTLNLKTSPWLSDDYAILPFWPATLDTVPLGSTLATTPQVWTGKTTVFRVELDCASMWLSEAGYQPAQTLEPPLDTLELPEYVPPFTFIQLMSADGCVYDLAISDIGTVNFFDIGGGWWSKTTDSNYPVSNSAFPNTVGGPTVLVNDSPPCGTSEIFFATTPFRNISTRAAGHVCSSTYYQAELHVTVTVSVSQSTVTFDEATFNDSRMLLDSTVFDVNSFEESFLNAQWATKFQPPAVAAKNNDGRPMIGGPLLPIAARHNWDVDAILASSSLANEAQTTKQRFFGEALQNAFTSIGKQNAPSFSGQTSLLESRVVVNFAIGISLGSAAASTSLVLYDQSTRACLEGSDRLSKEALRRKLGSVTFNLRDGSLLLGEAPTNKVSPSGTHTQKVKSDWRPAILHGWSGISALLFFVMLIAAIAALFAESRRSALYQTIFVYQKNISVGKGFTTDIAPYSIIPTLLAVIVKLWWGALEGTFKRLQPSVTMARRPTKASEALSLSYVDSVMLWASWKASKNKHWLLALITLGAFLTEVFTVSMSALWERTSGSLIQNVTVPRQYELRTIPSIIVAESPADPDSGDTVTSSILKQIYGSILNSWLYGGLIELSWNGSQPTWTKDEWAFAPVITSNLSLPNVQSVGSNTSTGAVDSSDDSTSPVNITVDSPGLRARIECTEIDMTNTSAWLMTLDFTHHAAWNQSTVPAGLDTGYSLSATNDGFFPIDLGPYKEVWRDFEYSKTPFFVDQSHLICCANETNGVIGRSAIGYWSLNRGQEFAPGINFTVKWIVGNPYEQQAQPTLDLYATNPYATQDSYFVWQSPPHLTALNCMPIFETVEADVTVDVSSSIVQDYSLRTEPINSSAAWTDAWFVHTNFTAQRERQQDGETRCCFSFPEDVTVSYGWLFLQSLLTAASTADIGSNGPTGLHSGSIENLYDRTFNFRMTGLNADFMSYSSLALQSNNIDALLDPSILFSTSNRVFSTFFQHFVADNVTAESGSYGFQPITAVVPWDLGPILADTILQNGSDVLLPQSYQDHNDTRHLSSTINATLHLRIEQLHMSPTAVTLCLSILAFLAGTTIWVYTRHRRYFKTLPRDVDSLVSVLGFVYASPKLLQWVAEHRHERDWGLKKGRGEVMAQMGWFDGARWGIELLDEGEGMGADARTMREKAKHHSGSSASSAETEALASGMSPEAR